MSLRVVKLVKKEDCEEIIGLRKKINLQVLLTSNIYEIENDTNATEYILRKSYCYKDEFNCGGVIGETMELYKNNSMLFSTDIYGLSDCENNVMLGEFYKLCHEHKIKN
jgi:hypothetical protein